MKVPNWLRWIVRQIIGPPRPTFYRVPPPTDWPKWPTHTTQEMAQSLGIPSHLLADPPPNSNDPAPMVGPVQPSVAPNEGSGGVESRELRVESQAKQPADNVAKQSFDALVSGDHETLEKILFGDPSAGAFNGVFGKAAAAQAAIENDKIDFNKPIKPEYTAAPVPPPPEPQQVDDIQKLQQIDHLFGFPIVGLEQRPSDPNAKFAVCWFCSCTPEGHTGFVDRLTYVRAAELCAKFRGMGIRAAIIPGLPTNEPVAVPFINTNPPSYAQLAAIEHLN